MGTGFKGGSANHRSISDNLVILCRTFKFHNGYFGEKGHGRSFTRNIISDNPIETAKQFYNMAAYGGVEKRMKNGSVKITKMRDGTILSFREITSSPGSPAVEINVEQSIDSGGIKKQKIHFAKEAK
jgi:hypothetical protein